LEWRCIFGLFPAELNFHPRSMSPKEFKEKAEGTIFRLRPMPKFDEHYIGDNHNFWSVLNGADEESFVLQNTRTGHECPLAFNSVRDFREPDFLVLRGQLILNEKSGTVFEPLAPPTKRWQKTWITRGY